MLYQLNFNVEYDASMQQQGLLGVWAEEADAALGAKSAGVVKGSMTDALKFLQAAMQACNQEDALSIAICQTMQATDTKITETETQGLGWIHTAKSKRNIIWHNGGTRGHRSFLGFVPETNTGIVILMNVAEVEITQPALNFLNSY